MKIVKNEENTITVLPRGDKYFYLCTIALLIQDLSLNIEQARQVADKILRLRVKLESETKTD